jgi:hypothetical protein
MNTTIHVSRGVTIGIRVLCAISKLTQEASADQLFSSREIRDMVEQLYPGCTEPASLSTHVSSNCVVNAPVHHTTEQRFLVRVSRDRFRLARASDLIDNPLWSVTWPTTDELTSDEVNLLGFAQSYFESWTSSYPCSQKPSLLSLSGSARHLFVNESAEEYIAKSNEAWN